jgi:hypothetical protein
MNMPSVKLSQERLIMKLSGIEVEVGGQSEKLPTCRHLSYLMSFINEAGKEYHRRHETLVHEQTLDDTPGIARIVSQVVCGLLMEDADPDDTEAFDGSVSAASSLIPLLSESCRIIPWAPEVSMNPGEMVLTRTPFGPTSFASPLAYVLRPPFAAA